MHLSRFFTLISGTRMPSLGLGTYLLKGDALREALDYALYMGYRHIDTAISYDNDIEIGEVISERIKAGRLKRENVFITTKIQNLFFEEKEIRHKIHQTQEHLKVKSVDMLLIHHPWEVIFKDNEKKNTPHASFHLAPYVDFCHTWKALEALHADGTVAHLGLSNFTEKQIGRVMALAKVPPSNVQLEAHIYHQQKRLKEFCLANNIVVSAYAPLGAPNRPSRHVSGDEGKILVKDSLIVEIANAYKKTPAQVLLNFLLNCGIAVLPKSGNKDRLKENMDCLDWSLSTEDFSRIQQLDRGLRFFKFVYVRGHPEFFEDEEF